MKKILIEIIPVLVGILLALFINNWRQSVSESNYINNSIISIIKENGENIDELNYSIQRQITFIDTLEYYMEDDRFKLVDIIRKTSGVYTPDLKSTTWKFLIQDSKHTLVEYEFINRLAEIEKYENLIGRYNDKVGDLIFQQGFFDDPGLKRVAYILFSDFGNNERLMIEELKSFNRYAIQTYEIDSTEFVDSNE